VRFLCAGDRALIVEFGDRVDRALSEGVLRLNAIIASSAISGVVETVPTFRSLMVHYDPLVTTRANLEQEIRRLLDRDRSPRIGAKLWRVPVCYEGEFAPDLAEVALALGTLTITYPGNLRMMLTPQPSPRQLWVAFRDRVACGGIGTERQTHDATLRAAVPRSACCARSTSTGSSTASPTSATASAPASSPSPSRRWRTWTSGRSPTPTSYG